MRNEEYHIQVAVVQWLRVQYPNALFTISPSGMKLPIGVAVKLKRMGYVAGTPDIMILEPRGGFHGLFVELKAPAGRMTPEQKCFLEELNKRGYLATVCFGFDEAMSTITSYMKLPI